MPLFRRPLSTLEKIMKKLVLAFILALVPFAANADPFRLHYQDTGEAVWKKDGTDGGTYTQEAGMVILNVLLENISSASSVFVPVPVTDARISRIQSVIMGDITGGDAVITVRTMQNDGTLWTTLTNGTSPFTISNSGSSNMGAIDTFVPLDTTNAHVQRDRSVVLVTNGGSTGDVDAVFTITIVPR